MAYVHQRQRSKLPSIAAVALVHAGIGYAFISGLAHDVIKIVTPDLKIISIAPDPAPPPPPPRPEQQSSQPAVPRDVVVRTPQILDTPFVPPVPLDPPWQPQVPVVTEPPPMPVAPSLAESAKVRGDRNRWISADDYPPSAIRAEQEGTVTISARVGADGKLAECAVIKSSGHSALDDATCRLYLRRARYDPALDGAGVPIASTVTDRIRWRLPE